MRKSKNSYVTYCAQTGVFHWHPAACKHA